MQKTISKLTKAAGNMGRAVPIETTDALAWYVAYFLLGWIASHVFSVARVTCWFG